ncbi:DNA repair protein RecO [Desulfarculus baarsii]
MAEPTKDQALTLRLRELGESDLLVDFFGRRIGRGTAIAKGARRSRKRFFGLLLVGHLLELELWPSKSGDLWRLEAAWLLENHQALRADWRRWLFGAPVLELLLRATASHDPHPAALDLALRALSACGQASDKKLLASRLLVFCLLLANELGYGLSLERCVRCGRPVLDEPGLALSPEGGLVCCQCPAGPRARPLAPGLRQGLRTALALPADKKDRLAFPLPLAREGLAFMHQYWAETIGADLGALTVAVDCLA